MKVTDLIEKLIVMKNEGKGDYDVFAGFGNNKAAPVAEVKEVEANDESRDVLIVGW